MNIKRQLTNLFVAILGTVFIAQVSIGKTPPPDPLVIQAFMVEQCPSDIPAADAPQPHVAGVLTSLIGLGIDSVLDALGKALSDAADAERTAWQNRRERRPTCITSNLAETQRKKMRSLRG